MLADGLNNFENNTNYANVMVSGDHGVSWQMGGSVPFGFDRTWRPIHAAESMVWTMVINP